MFYASFLFTIILINLASPLNLKNYVDETLNSFPKCCAKDEYLISNGTNFKCKQFGYQHFQIETSNILVNFAENCAQTSCVDFFISATKTSLVKVFNCDLNEIKNYVQFPKCCPLTHLYDPIEHRCVKALPHWENCTGLQVIKIGLSDCQFSNSAIIDYANTNISIKNHSAFLEDGKIFNSGSYCLDINYFTGKQILRACERYEDVCKTSFDDFKIRCLRKCCPDGEMYVGRKCVPTYTNGINVTMSSDRIRSDEDSNFGVIQAGRGKKFMATEKHKFHIDKIGNIHEYWKNYWTTKNSKEADYCIESRHENNAPASQVFFLFVPAESHLVQSINNNYIGALLIVSSICLLLTILCYLVLPEMQNLYGKLIIIYCCCMLAGFLMLVRLKFGTSLSPSFCFTIGFCLMFTFLGTFTWLNIICFDMWMAFGTMRVNNVIGKKRELKKLLFYNLYGWGLPTIFTGVALTFNQIEVLPAYLKPQMGTSTCFFEKRSGSYDFLAFFVIPLMLFIICNCVLFIKTITYCFKVKNEINRMKDSDKQKKSKIFNADKENLIMLMKLFLLMGVSWLFEILGSFIDFKVQGNATFITIEIIWDSINALQGVFVFCIFVLKKKVFVMLRNKIFHKFITRRPSELSSVTTTTNVCNSKTYNERNLNSSLKTKH